MPPALLVPVAFAAVFGALIGSFLNVVIHRLPRRMPMGMERSACPRCGTQIAWFDNIPVLSYLVLRGRCRACRAPISFRYPAVELLTAVLFALCALRALEGTWQPGLVAFLVGAFACATLLAAAFIDADGHGLPAALTARLLPVLALVGAIVVPALHGTRLFGAELQGAGTPGFASFLVGLAGAAITAAGAWGLRFASRRALGREMLRRDDVILLAGIGLLLGPDGGLFVLATGVLASSVVRLLGSGRAGSRPLTPPGPPLCAAALGVLLFRPLIAGWGLLA